MMRFTTEATQKIYSIKQFPIFRLSRLPQGNCKRTTTHLTKPLDEITVCGFILRLKKLLPL